VRSARGWIIAGVLAVALVAVVLYNQQNATSGNHSSNSDAADGTSALYQFASAMGHPTHQVEGSFAPPGAGGLMFVFTPTSAYTADEAAQTAAWVRDGGVLVYASETGDEQLDGAFGVHRVGSIVNEDAIDASPVLAGVSHIQGGGQFAEPLALSADQVAILRTGSFPIGYLQRLGTGTVVALTDPLVLANGYLDKADNGRFAADLLGLVSVGAPVAFDEYHHGVTTTDLVPQAWLLTPWGAALLWLLVAVFFGLLLRGRRFGPLIPRRGTVLRAEAEWAVAVGELLRRSGARSVTLGVLASATERAVADSAGLSVQPRERFWHALRQRAPEAAAELESAELALWSSTASERDLLEAARRLHRIAYPVAEERRRGNRQ
jgi:hypothetical protein